MSAPGTSLPVVCNPCLWAGEELGQLLGKGSAKGVPWGTCPVWLLPRGSFGMLEPARPGREQGVVVAPGTSLQWLLHSQGCFGLCWLFGEEDLWESPADGGLRSWQCGAGRV